MGKARTEALKDRLTERFGTLGEQLDRFDAIVEEARDREARQAAFRMKWGGFTKMAMTAIHEHRKLFGRLPARLVLSPNTLDALTEDYANREEDRTIGASVPVGPLRLRGVPLASRDGLGDREFVIEDDPRFDTW